MSFEDFLLGSFAALFVATVIGSTLTWVLIILVAAVYFYFISRLRGSAAPTRQGRSEASVGAGAYLDRKSMPEQHRR